MKPGFVYIITSRKNGTLYTGVTSDLIGRIYQHKQSQIEGFSKRHKVHHLVWFEKCDDIRDAIQREKNIKSWRRSWKLELIEKENPFWEDLYDSIVG